MPAWYVLVGLPRVQGFRVLGRRIMGEHLQVLPSWGLGFRGGTDWGGNWGG